MNKHLQDNSAPFFRSDDPASNSKKKKIIIGGILAFIIIVLIVILCVVFLVVLKKNDDSDLIFGYKLVSSTQNSTHFIAFLNFIGSDTNYLTNIYCPIVQNLTFIAFFESNSQLTLKFIDSNDTRFELPDSSPIKSSLINENSLYRFEMDNSSDYFYFKVIRNSNNETIFDTKDLNFVYSDRYIEISTRLAGDKIYGLGERRQSFLNKAGIYTIWSKEQPNIYDNGTGPNHQTYGHHPIYLLKEYTNNFHLLLLRNTNAMDIQISRNFEVITYKMVGGIIDFKLFIGENNPENIVKEYHKYLNGFQLMPFWSMGYHQGKYGYGSSGKILEILKEFDDKNIPIDSIWSDLDYMKDNSSFTVNNNFNISDLENIYSQKRYWIPVLTFEIPKNSDNESAYTKAASYDTLIKSYLYGNNLLNCGHAGKVGYTDFNHPNASKFLEEQLKYLYNKTKFSGIWLKYNEPYTFLEGEISQDFDCSNQTNLVLNEKINYISKTSRRLVNDDIEHLYIYSKLLPYIPGRVRLESGTLSMNATHYFNGSLIKSTQVITEIDFHTLNGYAQTKTTFSILKDKLNHTLPFISSASNMFGSGKFASHNTGDFKADWSYLPGIISEIFNFQLFGIPFTGVDICGTSGNYTEELCARYIQATSLFPLLRDYKTSVDDKQIFDWGVDSIVFQSSKASIKLRYSLLKWYYSIYIRRNGTGTIFKPLFFDYPNDPYIYELDNHYLLGEEILVAPLLKFNKTHNFVYFPINTTWFDIIDTTKSYSPKERVFMKVNAPLDTPPPIFIKEGSIINVQNVTNVKKTADLNNEFILKIALDINLSAKGYILGINDYTNNDNILKNCSYSNCIIEINAKAKIIDSFGSIQLDLTFSGDSIYQENYVIGVEVFGIPLNNNYLYLKQDISKSKFLIIKDGKLSLTLKNSEFYSLSNYVFNNGILKGELTYQGDDEYYKDNYMSPILKKLSLTITSDSDTELTIKINDPLDSRFKLPSKIPFPFTKSKPLNNPQYYFNVSNLPDNRFCLQIIRNSTKEILFDTSNTTLVFSERYMEITTRLPTKYLYGLGERRQGFLYKDGIYTIWPKDQFIMMDGGLGPDHQTYGQHPLYLMREKSNNYHIVFLKNSHAMDLVLSEKMSKLTYKLIEGSIEFKIFLGDNYPETSIKQYHNYINNYTLMPFWTLGFHQSRWGYTSSQMLLDVVNNFKEYDIPLDTIWSDIDYLNKYHDFTIDPNFLPKDFDAIRKLGVKWVPILDIGIAYDKNIDSPYQKGLEMDIYVKSVITNQSLINCVWPDKVSYPDFNHPKAYEYWSNQLSNLYKTIPFDGLWLDMNEPSAFVDGEININDACPPLPLPPDPSKPRILNSDGTNLYKKKLFSEDFPYIPGKKPLEKQTISMNSTHVGNGFFLAENTTELQFHGLSGLFESIYTYDFMKNNLSMKLPFILSRNTLFGQGLYTSHWTGDNDASWPFLQTAISEIFNFQIFGIPLVGVDLCGFADNTTEQLCARFMQAGAFFPFSRNHNQIFMREQEPYSWGKDSIVYKASRSSLKIRYSILKWYYSLFVRNEGAGTVFNPLFFEFPNDERIIKTEDQFILGKEIMVAPCLKEEENKREVIFPGESVWFDYFNGYLSYYRKISHISCPLDSHPPIYIKEGSIITFQDSTNVRNVGDLNNVFSLKIALNGNNTFNYSANGFMMGLNNFTDSNIVDNCTNNNNCMIKISAKAFIDENGKFNFTLQTNGVKNSVIIQENYFEKLEIFGINEDGINYSVIYYQFKEKILISEGFVFNELF